jgi:hypothetical protein
MDEIFENTCGFKGIIQNNHSKYATFILFPALSAPFWRGIIILLQRREQFLSLQ